MEEKKIYKEVKQIIELYKESKRFIAYTDDQNKDVLEVVPKKEIDERRKIIFNVECSIALLEEQLAMLFRNDINNDDGLWYVGMMSRSTYYRHRLKANEIFLRNYKRLETAN